MPFGREAAWHGGGERSNLSQRHIRQLFNPTHLLPWVQPGVTRASHARRPQLCVTPCNPRRPLRHSIPARRGARPGHQAISRSGLQEAVSSKMIYAAPAKLVRANHPRLSYFYQITRPRQVFFEISDYRASISAFLAKNGEESPEKRSKISEGPANRWSQSWFGPLVYEHPTTDGLAPRPQHSSLKPQVEHPSAPATTARSPFLLR